MRIKTKAQPAPPGLIHLREGDDGFMELAAKITALKDIRKGISTDKTPIHAEIPPYSKGRRNECSSKIGGK